MRFEVEGRDFGVGIGPNVHPKGWTVRPIEPLNRWSDARSHTYRTILRIPVVGPTLGPGPARSEHLSRWSDTDSSKPSPEFRSALTGSNRTRFEKPSRNPASYKAFAAVMRVESPYRTNARPIDAWAVLPGPGRALRRVIAQPSRTHVKTRYLVRFSPGLEFYRRGPIPRAKRCRNHGGSCSAENASDALRPSD